MKADALIAAGLISCAAFPVQAADICKAESGPRKAALVELYTSEGCSSCPPADRALSELARNTGAGEIVPLALHVSYWDGIGWKDVFAQTLFDGRQASLLAKGKNKVSYTPQFFANGREVRHWQDAFTNVLQEIASTPAMAKITLQQQITERDTFLLDVTASAEKPAAKTALFLAVTESQLVSRVLRGENSGVTLMHDDTARLLIGPVTLLDGKAQLHQEVVIPAGWDRHQLHAVAFVQDLGDGTVLQAVSTAHCKERKRS
jgi:hypothetical protein